MKNTMKAVVIYKAGGPENFVYEDRAIPQLRDGWTLVKVKGFGINHSEIFTREGLSPSVTFPRILGIECVGEVAQTTRSDLQVGQKIVSIMGEMGRAYDGSYAEYVLLPNNQVYPITTDLSWTELAAVPETYYTAFGSYKNLQIKETDTILVRAATSGVGLAFARLVKAKYPQVRIVGSVRSGSKQFLLKRQAYDDIIIDHQGILQTDEYFDKILELVGPATIKNSFAHIKENGIICSVGQLGGKWYLEDFDPIMELQRNSYLTTFYSGDVSQERIDELLAYISDYRVNVTPRRVFPLEQVAEAHRYIEGTSGFGKVVVLTEHGKLKREIGAKDFYQLVQTETVHLLDVREADEFEKKHLPHAYNLPLSSLSETYQSLDKKKTYYVICKMGGRSTRTCQFLEEKGYDVINIQGGVDGYPGWNGMTD